jgi:hypothetical protein
VNEPEPRGSRRALASVGRVSYWRRSGLIDPTRGELRQLKIIAALRRAGLSAQRVRAALERLRLSQDVVEMPVAFAVCGREVYVRHRDGGWEGDSAPGQLVFAEFLPLRPLDIDALPAFDRLPPRPARTRRSAAGPADRADGGWVGPAAGLEAAGRAGRDGVAAIHRYLARERDLDSPPPDQPAPDQPSSGQPAPDQPSSGQPAPGQPSSGPAAAGPAARDGMPPDPAPSGARRPDPLWVTWLLPGPKPPGTVG